MMDPKTYLAYARNQLTHVPGLDPSMPGREVKKVGVIGAGLMGAGIAACFLGAAIPTILVDQNEEALAKGREAIKGTFKAGAKRGLLTPDQARTVMVLLETTLDYDDLKDCDLIIEAVFERMDIKETVFERLGAVAKQGAILASNTSGLDIDRIAAASGRPEDVIGLHFFSPASMMPLLEIVRGKKTAPVVLKTALFAAVRIGKVGVVVGNGFGFAANRSLEGYAREGEFLCLEGMEPEDIDRALTNFGFPMGPCAVGDLAGIDIRVHVLDGMQAAGLIPDDPRYGAVSRALAAVGRLGQKTGGGMYDYAEGGRKRTRSDTAMEILKGKAAELGVPQQTTTDEDIVNRCLLPVINEAAKILDEGIISKPSDMDLIWIYGFGFPAAKGGPVYLANQMGLEAVKSTLDAYRSADSAHGDAYWAPSSALEKLFASS